MLCMSKKNVLLFRQKHNTYENAMKTITLKISEKTEADLKYLASEKGTTKSLIIREAIESYLADKNVKRKSNFLELAGDIIGSVEGPEDLSTNPKYMEDYGK